MNRVTASCPNLPGFVDNKARSSARSSAVKIQNGIMIERPQISSPQRQLGLSPKAVAKYRADQKMLRAGKPGNAVRNVNLVLRYFCYFKEAVNEAYESYRVRKVRSSVIRLTTG